MSEHTDWHKRELDHLFEAGWMARENGNPQRALAILSPLALEYIDLENFWKAAECLNHIGIMYKNMARSTHKQVYVQLASLQFNSAHRIMQHDPNLSNGRQAIQLMHLGEVDMLKGNFSEAAEKFTKAYEFRKGDTPALQGYSRGHAAWASYLHGLENDNEDLKESAKTEGTEALKMIRQEIESGSQKHSETQMRIWETGALIVFAKIAKIEGDDDSYNRCLNEAETIAQQYQLVTRLEQMNNLKHFEYSEVKGNIFDLA